jgi:hypothetical protein
LIGKLGEPEKIISSIYIMQDLTLMALGTKRGNIQVYESRNLMDNDFKMSTKIVDKK